MTAADEPERRDWLAEARELSGRSQDELARHIGVTPKAVSYWERGLATPRPNIRAALADALGFTVLELNRRLGIASAPDPAPLNGDGGNGASPFTRLAQWLTVYDRTERTSYVILAFDLTTFPALTQVRRYAAEVEISSHRKLAPEKVDYLVGMRLDRAGALDTAEYVALIPSYLLDACKGDASVMAEQLAHLLALADRPNITLLVIDPEHLSAAVGPFTLLGTAGPVPDTVAEFTSGEPTFSQSQATVTDRAATFEHMRSLALDADESRAAIAKSADRYAAVAEMTKGTAT